jgi:hypothetical protein
MNDSEKSNPLKQWLIPIAIIIGFIAHGWITTERYKIYEQDVFYGDKQIGEISYRLNTMTGELCSFMDNGKLKAVEEPKEED